MRQHKDLAKFHRLNQEKDKLTWGERYEIICKEFPAVVQLDWYRAFANDIYLFGRIRRHILAAGQQQGGKRKGPGARSPLDFDAAKRTLRQQDGEDFTYLTFPEAFKVLAQGRSIRHLARKVGLQQTMVFKLLHGYRKPDVFIMENVAEAFDKLPSYFMEYRTAYVIGSMVQQMEKAPEITADLYRSLKREQT